MAMGITLKVDQGALPAPGRLGRMHRKQSSIALLEGEKATLKKMYREGGGKIRLQPANSRLKPIFVDQDDIQVQGVVIGVLRRY